MIATLSFSQNTYPKKIQLNSDTLILITPNQLIDINKDLLLYSHLKKNILTIKFELSRKIKEIQKKDSEYKSKVLSLSGEISTLDKLNEANDKLITYYKKEVKIQKRSKVTMFFAGVTVGVATTSIIILTIK